MKSIDDLETFLRVVDSGDFSSAARSLNVTAGAISKQIKRLEIALGTTLFDRSTRRVSVTEEGGQIYECVKKGLSSINEAYDIAEQGRECLSGNIAISSPSTFNDCFLVDIINDFKQSYPGVSFYLDSSDRIIDLYAGGIDLAVRSGELLDSQLIARRIFKQERILVCSPSYLTKITSPIKINDITSFNSLVFGYPGFNTGFWTLENINNGEIRRIPLKKAMITDDGRALLSWTLSGQGIALRELWSIEKYLISGELVNLMPEWHEPISPIQIVRTIRNPVPKRISIFTEFLLESCQEKINKYA